MALILLVVFAPAFQVVLHSFQPSLETDHLARAMSAFIGIVLDSDAIPVPDQLSHLVKRKQSFHREDFLLLQLLGGRDKEVEIIFADLQQSVPAGREDRYEITFGHESNHNVSVDD